MKKYIALIRVGIQRELVYRTNFCIGIFSTVLLFVVEVAIWSAVYQGKEEVGSISYNSIMIYTVMTLLLQRLLGGGTDEEIGNDFQSGNIVTSLLTPLNLGVKYSMQELGKGLLNAFVLLLVFIPYCIKNREIVSVIPIQRWLLFVPAVVFSYILFSILNYMLKMACVNIFSGMFIPLTFYPSILRGFCMVLPFQSIYYFPLTIVMGEANGAQIAGGILLQLGWIAGLFLLCRLMNKNAMRRIVIQGG